MNQTLLFIFSLMLTAVAQASPSTGTRLRLAYPAEGTILSAQVGLVFEKTDILKKHGFSSAKAVAMGTGRELKTALVSGRADVIMTSETNFVILVGNGFDCFAINSLGSAGRMALVVPPGSSVQSLADLKGKKIATIFGTSIHQPAMEWVKAAGLEDQIQVLDMPSQGAMNAALKSGAVQAIMTWDPFLTQGVNQKQYRILQQKDFDLITVASPSFRDNGDAVARLNAATKEALLYVAQNKEQVNRWFSQMAKLDVKTIDDASRLNRNYSAKTLEDVSLSISPQFRDHMNRQARFLFAQKSLTRLPELGRYLAQ
ncbi:MAG: transporter substrate-binding domain-containing protein [Bdellovibrionales bacterium]|nr:transporter substrate-binding domain-containing protein [Bdellovibrionales bacterium]